MTGVSFVWKQHLKGEIPSNARITGHTEKNEPIYIVRAKHEGEIIPGQVKFIKNLQRKKKFKKRKRLKNFKGSE